MSHFCSANRSRCVRPVLTVSGRLCQELSVALYKVVHIIKCTFTIFIDNFRNTSTNSSIWVSVCRGSYDGYVKHKRNDPMCDPHATPFSTNFLFVFELFQKYSVSKDYFGP